MTPVTLVRRNLGRQKVQTLLLLVAVAAAFVLHGVLWSVEGSLTDAAGASADRRLVVSNRLGFSQLLPVSYVHKIRAIPEVETVGYRSAVGAFYREPRNLFLMIATDPPSYLNIYRNIRVPAAGRRDFLADRNSAIIGAALAKRFGLKPGSRVPVQSSLFLQGGTPHVWDFRIAAVFTGEPGTDTNFLISHYATYNASQDYGRDRVANILVGTRSAGSNERVIRQIDDAFRNSAAETRTATEEAYNRSLLSQLGDLQRLVLLLAGAGFLTLLLIVGNAMARATRERTREIGVLKAMGFSSARILGLVFGESLLLCVVGGVIGLLLASSILTALQGAAGGAFARLHLTGAAIGTSILAMAALTFLTGAAPAVIALRMPVAKALGREA